jgi:hypothetical protein
MIKAIDATTYKDTSRKLAAAIEEMVKKTQVSVAKELPMLPNYIILTPKQFSSLRKAHKIKDIGFGLMYVTPYNVMDIEVREAS